MAAGVRRRDRRGVRGRHVERLRRRDRRRDRRLVAVAAGHAPRRALARAEEAAHAAPPLLLLELPLELDLLVAALHRGQALGARGLGRLALLNSTQPRGGEDGAVVLGLEAAQHLRVDVVERLAGLLARAEALEAEPVAAAAHRRLRRGLVRGARGALRLGRVAVGPELLRAAALPLHELRGLPPRVAPARRPVRVVREEHGREDGLPGGPELRPEAAPAALLRRDGGALLLEAAPEQPEFRLVGRRERRLVGGLEHRREDAAPGPARVGVARDRLGVPRAPVREAPRLALRRGVARHDLANLFQVEVRPREALGLGRELGGRRLRRRRRREGPPPRGRRRAEGRLRRRRRGLGGGPRLDRRDA